MLAGSRRQHDLFVRVPQSREISAHALDGLLPRLDRFFQVLAERPIHIPVRAPLHLRLAAQHEKVIQVEIDVRAPIAAGATLTLPPILVELEQVIVEPLVKIRIAAGAVVDQVLHKIPRLQRRPSRVERLEDGVRQLIPINVDHHEVEALCGHFNQCLSASFGLVGVSSVQPFGDTPLEEQVSVRNLRLAGHYLRILASHDSPKRVAIVARRPNFEAEILVLAREHLAVQDQRLQEVCVFIVSLVEHMLGRVQQDLQRRKPLLTVDDLLLGRFGAPALELSNHDRAEKVGVVATGVRCALNLLGQRNDVLPERLPLIRLVPDVAPLVRRHDVPDVRVEQLARRGG